MKKKKSNYLKEMKPSVRRHLAFAVFLIFGVLGPVTILMESKLDPVSWKFVTLQTIATGGIAASIVYFYGKKLLIIISIVFWSSVITMNSGGVNFVFTQDGFQVHLGMQTGVVEPRTNTAVRKTELNEIQIRELYEQRAVLGIFAIVLLAVGYSRFLFVIRGEIRERTRLSTEMTIAQRLQESLLPAAGLEMEWCSVSGFTIPTSEIGGDYFDHIRLSDTKVAVIIADVSGHGVGSGIVSAMLKSALYGQLDRDAKPAIVMKNLNETLTSLTPKNMFVTCVYMIIDYAERNISLSVAGHPPVLLSQASEKNILPLKTEGMALGLKKGVEFNELTVPLTSGDVYVLYTDGVLEASNDKGEEFGADRLKAIFTDGEFTSPDNQKKIGETVMENLRQFTGSDTFRDDITIMEVRLKDNSRTSKILL
jgi:hypothetical protein